MPRTPIHPGVILADELSELGVTPTELSRQIAVPPNRMTQIIQGQRAITGDTALRLGHWFQTSAQFWLTFQLAYDLDQAALSVGPDIEKLPTRPAIGEEPTHVYAVVSKPQNRQSAGQAHRRSQQR